MDLTGWEKLSLEELAVKVAELPKDTRDSIAMAANNVAASLKWIPQLGPQMDAYFSRADILLYGGSAGSGKAISIDTPIPTPSGWTEMSKLRVGSTVYDESGNETRVIGTSGVMLGRECFLVTFDDGEEIIADAEHLWVTRTAKERGADIRLTDEWRAARRAKRPSRAGKGIRLRPDLIIRNSAKEWAYKAPPRASERTTREIFETLYIRDGAANHSIEIAAPIVGRRTTHRIPPYTLGYWLGDGSSSAASITTMDREVIDEIGKDGFVLELDESSRLAGGKADTYRVRRIGQQIQWEFRDGRKRPCSPMSVMVDLREIGVLYNKHIPDSYLRAEREDRELLLSGLMDSDGCANIDGSCEYTGINSRLVDGVRELLLTLGIKAAVTEGRAMLNGRDCGPKYRILFTPEFQIFKINRKASRLKLEEIQTRYRRRFIVGVEKVSSVPVKCIKIDARSGQFLCGRGLIPTHNSDLVLGLALTAHKRTLIMRQQYNDLDALTGRLKIMNGTSQGYNGSNPPSLKTADGRFIQFTGAKKEQWQGSAFDLKCFDESVQIPEDVIRFHIGWVRSADEGQRTRVVLASNPPVMSTGDWIIPMFAPWLDITHPNPALPGELRWVVMDPDNHDFWVDGPQPHQFPGQEKPVIPMSRTFIPGKLSDNIYYARTDYGAKLDAMPEPWRSAFRDGNFMASRSDQDNQVIPSAWIVAAQDRWTSDVPREMTMTAIGFDVGAGGADRVVLAPRYGAWFAPLITLAGKDCADGSSQAALIARHRRDGCAVVVDVGGGYGGDAVGRLKDNGVTAIRFNGSEGSTARAKDGSGRIFVNKRAEAWWRLREALNPDQTGGSIVALPDDPELRSELSSVTFIPDLVKIQIEDKKEVKKRLGRSPDKADAVVMAFAPGAAGARRVRFGNSEGNTERPSRANVGYSDIKRY